MPQATSTFDWLDDLSPALAGQEAWQNGSYNQESLFHLVYETDGPFAISCGAALLTEHIRKFRFTPERIQQLSRARDAQGRALFTESFLNHLQRMRLRVGVTMPPEGMLLLPGEPLAILNGPYAQILMMESALRWLIWRSTHWATRVAVSRWDRNDWQEEDTPAAPLSGFHPDGWKIRAEYIGGATADDILDTIRNPSRPPNESEGLQLIWKEDQGPFPTNKFLTQARRVYKANHALGDIWLNDDLEREASVSKTSASIKDARTHRHKTLRFTRFQNIYQPMLVKGHPVRPLPRIGYLRQRTLKQMEAFHYGNMDAYPHGWMVLASDS